MGTSITVESAHSDLITCLSFSPHSTHLASSSLDHSIRVVQRNPQTNQYDLHPSIWRAHDGPVLSIAWAPPELGLILASSSTDGTIKIWLEPPTKPNNTSRHHHQTTTTSLRFNHPRSHQQSTGVGGFRSQREWINTQTLTEPRGTVRSISFSPQEFGLKLAAISSDSRLRVWECLNPIENKDWSLIQEIDLNQLPLHPTNATNYHHHHQRDYSSTTGGGGGFSSGSQGEGQTTSGAMPNASNLSGANSSVGTSSAGGGTSVEGRNYGSNSRGGGATIESDGAWSLTWCREHWWGERIAVSAGTNGIIRLFHLPSDGPWSNFLNLVPSRTTLSSTTTTSTNASTSLSTPTPFSHAQLYPSSVDPYGSNSSSSAASNSSSSASPYNLDNRQQSVYNNNNNNTNSWYTPPTCSLAWAPPSGRSFQWLAAGSRDGKARVWKIFPPSLGPPLHSSNTGGGGNSTRNNSNANLVGLNSGTTIDNASSSLGTSGGGGEGEWTAQLDVELDESKKIPSGGVSGRGGGTQQGGGGSGNNSTTGTMGTSPVNNNGSNVNSSSSNGGNVFGSGAIGATKVEWNVTGTVLSTSGGEDGRVRLWKSTYTGQWRQITSLSTETPPNLPHEGVPIDR